MPIEYNNREDTTKHPICECGHGDFNHKHSHSSRGQCERCLCPQFKKEQELTITELAKLELYRRGFPKEVLDL